VIVDARERLDDFLATFNRFNDFQHIDDSERALVGEQGASSNAEAALTAETRSSATTRCRAARSLIVREKAPPRTECHIARSR
jgi:hypothetical protein